MNSQSSLAQSRVLSAIKRGLRILAPVAFLATGACFASRNDVRLLQKDVLDSRTEFQNRIARSDSIRNAQIAALNRLVAAIPDTLRSFERRFWSQGGSQADAQQKVQQAVDQLLAQFMLISTELDSLRREIGLVREMLNSRPMGSDSGSVQGPKELLRSAQATALRGATSTALEEFQAIVSMYPDSAEAGEALYNVGQIMRAQNEPDKADSAYVAAFTRFPKGRFAPEAMYLHGLLTLEKGQKPQARAIFQRVITEYPNTTAAGLARTQRDNIPPQQGRPPN